MEDKDIKEVALSLGSNVGDSYQTLLNSLKDISSFVDEMKVSSFYRTDPMNLKYQPDFLNLAVTGKTNVTPSTLLKKVNSIEKKYGRAREIKYGPRTLDIDIILLGDAIVKREDLVIPHPQFRKRLFVVEPLAEIAPEMKDPVDGKEVHEILTEARGRFSDRIEKL